MAKIGNREKQLAVQLLGTGIEPTWVNHIQTSEYRLELMKALNFYAATASQDDSKTYSIWFAKKELPQIVSTLQKVHRDEFKNIGFVLRIKDRGFDLMDSDLEKMKNRLESLAANYKEVDEVEVEVKPARVVQPKPNLFLEELEYFIDGLVLNKPIKIDVNGHDAKSLAEGVKQIESLLLDIKENEDQYNQTTAKTLKSEMKKLKERISSFVHATRKTRVKAPVVKKVNAAKVVQKLNYLGKSEEFNIQSVNPIRIVGSRQLWVYDVVRRKFGFFVSTEPAGLTVSGTSIRGYDLEKSLWKTIRKPDLFVKEIVNKSVSELKKIFDSIASVEGTISSRLTSDTLLLKLS
jgi:ElaB/YqjD/DUF883 family membrane-anchored ribosome-binding protein